MNFSAALADLSSRFGAETLKDIMPADMSKVPRRKPSKRDKALKWGEYTQLGKLHKNVHAPMQTGLIHSSLMSTLRAREMEIIIHRFKHQGCEMDVFSISKGFAYEFEIKISVEDYIADFKKVYYFGPSPVNKHAALEAGRAAPNFFYFVVPAGMLHETDIPEHCGLIYAYTIPESDIPLFKIEKPAPLLHAEYVTTGLYKTVATRLCDRYTILLDKHEPQVYNILDADQWNENLYWAIIPIGGTIVKHEGIYSDQHKAVKAYNYFIEKGDITKGSHYIQIHKSINGELIPYELPGI